MTNRKKPDLTPHQFAEWICRDPSRLETYTETATWIENNQNSANLMSPVGAAFSTAKRSLVVVNFNHRKKVDSPDAWAIAHVDLDAGTVRHPEVLNASLDNAHHLWLQVVNSPSARFAEANRLRRDQRRFEAKADMYEGRVEGLRGIEYHHGLLTPKVDHHDMTALDALVKDILNKREPVARPGLESVA